MFSSEDRVAKSVSWLSGGSANVDNGDIEFIGYKNSGIEIAKARYSAQHAENDCSDDDLGSDSDN